MSTVKQISFLVVLLAAGGCRSAHAPFGDVASASGQKNLLGARSSVVLNWSSVCQDLCSIGLGGPGCGPHCSAPDSHQSSVDSPNLDPDSHEHLCRTALCMNELGANRCVCDARSSNANDSVSIGARRDRICASACDIDLRVNGCSGCFGVDETAQERDATTIATGTSTADWTRICEILCRNGQGGSACNCDKPPFF